MAEQAEIRVMCRDYTRGHSARITVSKIGTGKAAWAAWWGRVDASVYVVGLGVLVPLVWSAQQFAWYRLLFQAMPFVTASLLTLVILLGVPFLAGTVAHRTG